MITRIRIRNFQSHAKTELKLEQVTSIVGSTDAGKSAVVRALRWALLNQPNGTAFIRKGKTKAFVEVIVDDVKVKRERGKQLNQYTTSFGDFKALGGKVPEDLTTLFGVSDLNFQGQHDSPFWFTASAGQVAKNLNAIVDLDIIDKIVDRARSSVREINRTIKFTKERLALAEEARDRLS